MKVVASLDGVGTMLRKRGLEPNGRVQKLFTSEVYRLSEPYTPFQQGILAHGATVADDHIIYNTPYAHYQWLGEVMAGRAPKHYTGKAIQHHGAPRRGKQWTIRMWRDKKNAILDTIANAAGGKPEP